VVNFAGEFYFAETSGEARHLLGEEEPAGLEIANMAGETFNFSEVVGGKEDGGFGGTFEEAFDQLIANKRIEAVEGLIQDDEARAPALANADCRKTARSPYGSRSFILGLGRHEAVKVDRGPMPSG